jgi:hypothetical protein
VLVYEWKATPMCLETLSYFCWEFLVASILFMDSALLLSQSHKSSSFNLRIKAITG